jgi:hypothetical protein
MCRETREGWPLLAVETEANRDSRSTYERGPSLSGSCAGTRDLCLALAALVCPVKLLFFPTEHYFTSFVSLPSKLGRQSCRSACLLICVSVHVNANRYRRVSKSTSKYDIMTSFYSYP